MTEGDGSTGAPTVRVSSAAARSGIANQAAVAGHAGAARCGAVGLAHAQLARVQLDVLEDRVDLPRLARGPVQPHLVLAGVATRDPVLHRRRQSLVRKASPGGGYLLRRNHFDTKMVDA